MRPELLPFFKICWLKEVHAKDKKARIHDQ